MRVRNAAAGLAALSLLLVGCSGDTESASSSASPVASDSPTPTASPTAFTNPETIAEQVAAGTENFSILHTALVEADLEQVLDGAGPFTVFAPTDEAFEELPAGLLDTLLEPANKDVLAQILTYHVVEAEVMSADIQPGKVPTVEGEDLTIKVTGNGKVTVNGADVTVADIEATNGVIHVIDDVLVPPNVDVNALLQ